MLFIVSTPIGNLSDLTYRAASVLKLVKLILCEDTRVSRKLLDHYDIATPVKSLHSFNEAKRCEEVASLLRQGDDLALISDAGTPALSDPGERLIAYCQKEKLPLTALPGPSAVITALILSGFPTAPFQFVAFLPKSGGKRVKVLQLALLYEGVTIAYESPARLLDTLKELDRLAPQVNLAVGRELTKRYEEVIQGTPKALLERWEKEEVRGEIVLMIQGTGKSDEWEALTPQEHVEALIETYTLSKQEAIKIAAQMRGLPKRDIYKETHHRDS